MSKIKPKLLAKSLLNRFILPAVYFFCRASRVDSRLILLADGHTLSRPLSMELIYDALVKEGFVVREYYIDFGSCGILKAAKFMLDFMRAYAKCSRVYICSYFLPVSSCKKRSETTVVQLWHACGCLKKFGHDAKDDIPPDFHGDLTRNIDYVTVSSPECEAPFSSALGIDRKKIVSTGVSRTDSYFDPEYTRICREEFFSRYPHLRGKRIILYAPTFRKNAGNPEAVGLADIINLKNSLPDDYVIVSKLHPHLKAPDGFECCDLVTERIYPAADLLITDYSSVVFDFAFFNKPVVLFAPDLESYAAERGFYIDYSHLPGTVVTDPAQLKKAVIDSFANYNPDKNTAFRQKYLSSCDGKSTGRIINLPKAPDFSM